ncbi:response regulator [Ruminiclostridium josui]|uniref:response regulator n=1 Tax=Ruminiclostridium josui TaxID=1499 RepID=UPI0004ADF310|nr:response regulator [Ruminiclostridium josui]
MKMAKVYDLLISCPGDVSQFVGMFENVASKFNNFYGRENGVVLRTISWTNNAFPQFGGHPQKILDKQIVDKADFAVAVFWTRFGTETEDYGSGTEEEIERMLKDGKHVFLYFLDKPVSPSKIDQEQYAKIQAFKEKHKNEGLFFTVPDENALVNIFREHLELYIDSIHRGVEFSKTRGNKLILWVDDCPENNVYVRNILENYGLKFDLALSTERALNFMENNTYSLVISDMGRKEGPREGYVLLKKIRDSGNKIPFIIFSSDGSRLEHRVEAEKNGAQGSTDTVPEVVDMVLKELLNT